MNILNKLSELTSIDSKYWILIFKTLVFFLIFDIAKRIAIRLFKRIKDSKKEYEYRKDYSMTILKSMENSRATALSTYLSKSGENEKKRFKNVLDIKTKKKGIFALICILGLIIIIGSIIVVKHSSNNNFDNAVARLFSIDFRIVIE